MPVLPVLRSGDRGVNFDVIWRARRVTSDDSAAARLLPQPDGANLIGKWDIVVRASAPRRFPLVDLAYLGFGDGIARTLRHAKRRSPLRNDVAFSPARTRALTRAGRVRDRHCARRKTADRLEQMQPLHPGHHKPNTGSRAVIVRGSSGRGTARRMSAELRKCGND